MKKHLIFIVTILILATLACRIQNFQMNTIETQRLFISESLPDNRGETKLVFKMSGGEFTINPGSDGLVTGSIAYNVAEWEPQLTRRDNFYEIRQSSRFGISGLPTGDVENTWNFSLTDQLPLDLSIEGGASENNYDFTGLQITNLNIIQGASDTTIKFDSPNPQVMNQFAFTTGASSAKFFGLANANFSKMNISCGAGDYTLDFHGVLTQDAQVEIKAGISNITIIIPAGMKAVVNNQGTISNVNSTGTWLLTDKSYATLAEGYTLTINLQMAVGNVNLIHEE